MDDEQNGYVSIWAGHFTSEEQLHTYLATVYQGEDETDEAFSQKLAKLFYQKISTVLVRKSLKHFMMNSTINLNTISA